MGLYSITTRATGTVLTGFGSTSDIFNADHENHVTHTEPESINSAEATLTDMQATTDPGPGGVVSLPDSMTAEVRRERFALAQVKQNLLSAPTPPQWYQPMGGAAPGIFRPPTAVRRELTTATNVPSGSATLVPFNSLDYSFGVVSSLSGISVPVAGYYIIGASVGFGGAPTKDSRVILARTLSTAILAARDIDTGTDASNRVCVVETIAHLTPADTFRVFVFQNHGSPVPLLVNASIKPAVWMALVGR